MRSAASQGELGGFLQIGGPRLEEDGQGARGIHRGRGCRGRSGARGPAAVLPSPGRPSRRRRPRASRAAPKAALVRMRGTGFLPRSSSESAVFRVLCNTRAPLSPLATRSGLDPPRRPGSLMPHDAHHSPPYHGTRRPIRQDGYGANPPDPGRMAQKLALSFVLNYEEGGENTVLNDDAASEIYLHEVPGGKWVGRPARTVETQFDYGARAGVWRILRLFAARGPPHRLWRGPRAGVEPGGDARLRRAGSMRWRAMAGAGSTTIPCPGRGARRDRPLRPSERLTGKRPVGWYTGRISPNTRRLVAEHGGFLYDSDSL